MDELRAHMQAQTDLLKAINENISGLRGDFQKAGKDAMENSMAKAMEQMKGMFKGTPLEGMIAKMGGSNG